MNSLACLIKVMEFNKTFWNASNDSHAMPCHGSFESNLFLGWLVVESHGMRSICINWFNEDDDDDDDDNNQNCGNFYTHIAGWW